MKYFYIILFFIFLWINVEAQKADSTAPVLRIWSFENSWNEIQKEQPDTFLTNFQNYLPIRSEFVATLGNSGSATFPLTYNIPDEEIPYFYIPFKIYYNADRHIFYNTRKPYTRINFAAGTSKEKGEQYINILHTQNVNRHLNFSIRANGHNSTGYFLRQENRNNSFRFSTNYMRKKYQLQAYFNIEKFRLTENGGIQHDDYIIDSLYKSDNLNVNLNNAKNTIVFRESFIHQKIALIGKTDTIDSVNIHYKSILELQHIGRFQRFKKLYTDIPTNFYNNIYIDNTATNDSTNTETFYQNLAIVITENNPLKTAFLLGVNYDYRNYYFYYSDTLLNSFGLQTSIFKVNNTVYSGYLTFEQWLTGYLKGNSRFDGRFAYKYFKTKDTIQAAFTIGYWTRHTDYFENRYYSNNFSWNNDFANSYISTTLLSVNDNRFNFGFSANFYTVKNYVYFDTLFMPKQQNHTIKIMSGIVYKNFKWGHIHFNNRAIIQQSSNDSILRLPMFVGVHSVYYQFAMFKKVLKVQTGTELFYFTKYFAPTYVPATSLFALQNERQTGDYPYIDVFINLNLKRAGFFVKMEHANYSLMPENYFMTPHYPQTQRVLKFGISWNFYD